MPFKLAMMSLPCLAQQAWEREGGRGRGSCTGTSEARAFWAGTPLPAGLRAELPSIPLVLIFEEVFGFDLGLDLCLFSLID